MIGLVFMSSLLANAIDNGVYQITVVFKDGPVFQDILVKESSEKSSFTVPGNFTKPITLQERGNQINFLLSASEFNQSFEFEFIGSIDQHQENDFSGKIVDHKTKKKIGEFKGVKLYEYGECFSGYHQSY